MEDFCQRQFAPARGDLDPAPKELPPGTTTISATDIEDMNTSANATQQRINHLPMSKYNTVKGRTGIVYNASSSRKLQTRLSKAQEALKKEKAMKARVMVNFVRSRTRGVINLPVINKLQTQLSKVQTALEAEKASHQGTRDFLNHQSNGRADAEAELELLKARLETGGSELEGHAQLETISETEESLASDGTNSQEISEESTAEPARVECLEAQLAVEQANYRDVFMKKEKLKQDLEDLQAEYNKLEDSRDTWKETVEALEQQADVKAVRALREKIESDNAHHGRRIGALETQLGIEQTSREEAEEAVRDLRERCEWLEKELLADASEQENPDHVCPGPDPNEEIEEPKKTIERHEAGMEEYWAKKKEFDERREKYLEAERVAMAEGHGETGDNGTGDDDDKADDGRRDVASKAATDADLAQADHTAELPDSAEHTPPTEMPLDDGRPADLQDLEPASQRSSLNGSVSAFIPSALPGRSIILELPEHTPAPRVTGPESVRNAAGEPAPVSQVPIEENLPESSSIQQPQEGAPPAQIAGLQPSTTSPSELNTNPNAEHEIRHASGEDSGQRASTQADKSMRFPIDEETQDIAGDHRSKNIYVDEGIGNDGWSDFDDEHDENEEDDGAPTLGKYKVTRAPPNDQGDDGLPMPGSYPAPDRGSSDIIVLDKNKVTRKKGNAEDHKKAPEAEEKPKNDSKPLLPHLAHLATKGGLPQEKQTARRRPSNYFPGIENATTTHAEEVGDAFADYVRECQDFRYVARMMYRLLELFYLRISWGMSLTP